MEKKLLKYHKKHPDAFWLDTILFIMKGASYASVNQKYITQRALELVNQSSYFSRFNQQHLPIYVARLLSDGYIEYAADSKDTYKITAAGIAFIEIKHGYLKMAVTEHKAERRFNFEYYKIGYDTIISAVALILSIIALVISVKK